MGTRLICLRSRVQAPVFVHHQYLHGGWATLLGSCPPLVQAFFEMDVFRCVLHDLYFSCRLVSYNTTNRYTRRYLLPDRSLYQRACKGVNQGLNQNHRSWILISENIWIRL